MNLRGDIDREALARTLESAARHPRRRAVVDGCQKKRFKSKAAALRALRTWQRGKNLRGLQPYECRRGCVLRSRTAWHLGHPLNGATP